MSGPAEALPLPGGTAELEALLGPFLSREEWAQSALGSIGSSAVELEVTDVAVLKSTSPGLASVVVSAGGISLHVLLGWRGLSQVAASSLRPGAVLGTGEDDAGEVVLYDALSDGELCIELLSAATGGTERAKRSRLVGSLVSHSALVYDERLFMKCYRVIEPRPRPEIEMMLALDRVGFNHLLAPVAHWSRPVGDLGLVREFLAGAVEGKALALTSLRDLLARAGTSRDDTPFEQLGLSGGDLADEMRRLGETTAELHLALADAFGVTKDPAGGPEIRVHGDYHLRRVMRFEAGWLVAGFGDDPLVSPEAGSASQGEARRSSPLDDVTDLFVSLAQVAHEAVLLQSPATAAHAEVLAEGWARHNQGAFLSGYLRAHDISHLVPAGRAEVEGLLSSRVPQRLGALSAAGRAQ